MCSVHWTGGSRSFSFSGAGHGCPSLPPEDADESGLSVVGDVRLRIGGRRLTSALVYLCLQSCGGETGVQVERGCRSKILSVERPARGAKACRT
jgi:hypothetical protein